MNAIAHTKKGLVTCVFDTTDRIQHMFYRYLDPSHPANAGKDTEQYRNTLEDLYQRMDQMLGRIRAQLGNDTRTLLCVISDHGFTQFKRGVNLNAWLRDQGLLALKDGKQTGGDWFESVDWARTKAFSLGLTGLFINRKGRERNGIVGEGAELAQVRKQIKEGLLRLRDPKDDSLVVLNVFETDEVFDGPYKLEAPDLLIGYNHGFRNSWDCATGAVSKDVFSDNTKSWSGDHCVDPRIVPGVLFSSRRVELERPHLMDLAPTVLKLFGVPVPGYMKGRSIFEPATRPSLELQLTEAGA
ncbi:MAG: alkaline phosphatase family protein [Planctomycetota bacterium]